MILIYRKERIIVILLRMMCLENAKRAAFG